MEYYSLMPENCVDASQELIDGCGSLYPYITTLKKAQTYAKSLKKRFPNATLNLFKGRSWGELELVEVF